MSTATSVTTDRLRWWIVGAALTAAVISAASVASDVAATDTRASEESAAPAFAPAVR